MKKIGVLSLIVIPIISNGQKKDTCVCLEQSVNVIAYIKGFPFPNKNSIQQDSLKDGFSLDLSDNSYRIVGFKFLYEFPADPFYEEVVKGNKATTRQFPFLSNMPGHGEGHFEFSCITLEKNGKLYNAKRFYAQATMK